MSDDAHINRRTTNSTTNTSAQAQNTAKDKWQQEEPFPIAKDTRVLKVAVGAACDCKTQLEAALAYAEWGIPVFPCLDKPRTYKGKLWEPKSPMPELGKGGLYHATIDPEQIRKWWTRWPTALIGVPGGRRTGIWVLDIDSKEGHDVDGIDAWDKLQGQRSDAFTRMHWTGSNGLHSIFQWNADRPIGCPTSTVPPGMEVKGEGGYVIFPPSPYERNGQTVQYRTSIDSYPEPAPSWLYDLILGPRQRKKSTGANAGKFVWSEEFGQKKLDELCELVKEAEQHHWDETCRKVFKFGRWVGGGAYDVTDALEELLKAAKLCRAPSDYPDNVKRAFENGVAQPEGPFIEEEGVCLDDFHAYMPQHQYIYTPTREFWPASSVNARIPSVDSKIKASTWVDQNHPVEQMTWAPGEGMLIPDRLISDGGWFAKAGVTCFNLYRPPTIVPGDASQAGPWLDHINKVWEKEDAEHIVKWCAQRVQHPGVKINHALVLGSEMQGIGKDAMLEPVKRAIGPWNFDEVNPQQVLGRFNGFYKRVILRINEARDLGDINRYQFYDHMKMYTASPPDVLRIDEKYLNEHSVLNCVGIILTTNYKINGIYLPAEDRRHYVAWSDRKPEDFDKDYWNKLFTWYDAGGDCHVAAFLAAYDLSGFDPKAPPPKTQAFWDIVEANRAPENSELADILDELGNPKATTLRHIIDKASPELGNWLRDHKNRRIIPNRLKDCGYVRVKNPDRTGGDWRIAGSRQVVYARSELSIKEQIEAVWKLEQVETVPEHLF
jgi:hypothetical protein